MTSPGRALAERYHAEVVGPLLGRLAPDLAHTAGLLGAGSEVLGLDDERSADHDFGPRLTVLVDDEDAGRVGSLLGALDDALPEAFEGFPVRYPRTRDPVARHRVVVTTVHGFARRVLGVDPVALSPVDWLSITGQAVLEITGGPIFHDGTRAYGPLRDRLAWYPDDVWRHVVASGWRQVANDLPIAGRTAERGDDLGSRILTARVARRLVHLAFLLHRTWAPYDKWSGTALHALPGGPELADAVGTALAAATWSEREAALADAVDQLAVHQRAAGLPAPTPAVVPFFDRPFLTVDPGLADEVTASIEGASVRELPAGVGCIEQWCDAADVLTVADRRRRFAAVLA